MGGNPEIILPTRDLTLLPRSIIPAYSSLIPPAERSNFPFLCFKAVLRVFLHPGPAMLRREEVNAFSQIACRGSLIQTQICFRNQV